MIKVKADIVILGGGFSGSLLALTLNQLGLDSVVIEKNRHPRFAIGESSTPLANLSLEKICQVYDLPQLLPLAKYGSWQKHYSNIPCGLKRGFSFFKHELEKPFAPQSDHANELLVAANPSNEVGDTHWFREHFDYFLATEAQKQNIPYFDNVEISSLGNDNHWTLRGNRSEETLEIEATVLVDATGGSDLLPNMFGNDFSPEKLHTNSWAIYNHFTGVLPWQEVLTELSGNIADHPFNCDDAALHHIFDDGWMWVLRFNNGITSAGFVFDGHKKPIDTSRTAEQLWQLTIQQFPSIAKQFEFASPTRPFVRTGRLQRRTKETAGKNWVMLPHSAYFIDPLLSAGNAHTLIGIERITAIFQQHWGKTTFLNELAHYDAKLQLEIDFLDRLIHGCYSSFSDFDFFVSFSMYYFAGATYSEHRRRLGLDCPEDAFLFSHDAQFKTSVLDGFELLQEIILNQRSSKDSLLPFTKKVAEDIEPYNIAGLCRLNRQNMYPYDL